MRQNVWRVHNNKGSRRVVVTKTLPGKAWLEILVSAGCRVDVCTGKSILGPEEIMTAIGDRCDGAIGQIPENWNGDVIAALAVAGGKAYSNYAVGYNNVDVEAATRHGIAVGNTPGVLTETTAELAATLTLAAARRVGEGERIMRAGEFDGWLPGLLLGNLLHGRVLGLVGAGRIGMAYALIMVEGFKMDLLYHSRSAKPELEERIAAFGEFLRVQGERPVSCHRVESLDELLGGSDVVSIHVPLTADTHHLIDGRRLTLMKDDAILVNTSRGPVVDEAALVDHCRDNPDFRAGLDVFENEPALKPGLADLDNVTLLPHLGSGSISTRRDMATLAAQNVAAVLLGYPVQRGENIASFLQGEMPEAAPSIVNAAALGL